MTLPALFESSRRVCQENPNSSFLQRNPSTLPNPQMIEYIHVQQLACLEDGARHGNVVRRAIDRWTFLRRFKPQPVSSFDGRFELRRFRLADAVLVAQLVERRVVQAGKSMELEQKPLPRLVGVPAG